MDAEDRTREFCGDLPHARRIACEEVDQAVPAERVGDLCTRADRRRRGEAHHGRDCRTRFVRFSEFVRALIAGLDIREEVLCGKGARKRSNAILKSKVLDEGGADLHDVRVRLHLTNHLHRGAVNGYLQLHRAPPPRFAMYAASSSRVGSPSLSLLTVT